MGFKLVFNSGGGVFILGNVAFVRGFGVVAFVNFLHVGGENDCLFEFVAVDSAR